MLYLMSRYINYLLQGISVCLTKMTEDTIVVDPGLLHALKQVNGQMMCENKNIKKETM